MHSLLTGSSGSSGGGGLGTGGDGESNSGGGSGTSSKHSIAGPVAGGVVGGLVFVALLVLGFVFWRRRRQDREPKLKKEPKPTAFTPTPFVSSVPRDGDYSPGLTPASGKTRQTFVEEVMPTPSSSPSSESRPETLPPISELSTANSPQAVSAQAPTPTPVPLTIRAPGEVEVLRAEVQALRQAMQHNVTGLEDDYLPPPMYTPRS